MYGNKKFITIFGEEVTKCSRFQTEGYRQGYFQYLSNDGETYCSFGEIGGEVRKRKWGNIMYPIISEILVLLTYLIATSILDISVRDSKFWFLLLLIILSYINGITTGRKR